MRDRFEVYVTITLILTAGVGAMRPGHLRDCLALVCAGFVICQVFIGLYFAFYPQAQPTEPKKETEVIHRDTNSIRRRLIETEGHDDGL